MPHQQPKKHVKKPKHAVKKQKTDDRSHPIQGMLYRVRDKDWAELWGEGLPHADAVQLKAKTVGARKSTTARIEACDVPVADHLTRQAAEARLRAREAGRPIPSGNYVGLFSGEFGRSESGGGEGGGGQRRTPTPSALDTQLANMRSPAFAAAGVAAKEANARVSDKEAAAQRRELYRQQREEADAENARLAKEADDLEAELGDAADVPEGDIDDFLGGVGAQPTDEEIRKAQGADAS